MHVPGVKEWRCHEHGYGRDHAVLAGGRSGIAAGPASGGRRRRHLPHRCATAARFARCSWLVCWLAFGGVFPAGAHRACVVSHHAPPVGRVATAWAAQRADQILTAALEESFGPHYRDRVCHPLGDQRGSVRRDGLWHSVGHRRRYAAQTSDIAYGPGGRDNLLDIWRQPDLAGGDRRPVLVQVPGGGWTINGKRGQAYPLMGRMVELGWICVSIDYRKSPRSAWPAHIVDVKRAIAWVRDNIADYGGDPGFIAITGGSAGPTWLRWRLSPRTIRDFSPGLNTPTRPCRLRCRITASTTSRKPSTCTN
ncbi:alpha/beta hydrolase fold family protein [Mycobacterium xenopi 3993]|nr:alpha/beta hydrolase fold family protein [Mycobacterium xenopi 3993]